MRIRQRIRASSFARHSHEDAYAALVVAGGYEEAGDIGRLQVRAGDVVFHDSFEAHLDRFAVSGAAVLNLRLPAGCLFTPGIAKVANADLIVRASEKSQTEALDLLLRMTEAQTTSCADWPDELAATLIHNPSLMLIGWAEDKGLLPWTVSRGFAQVFGVSPEAFRARARARQALRLIRATDQPLATIAYQLGFADQSHMTRSVKQLTGIVPNVWRGAANRFKTRHARRM